MNTYILFVYHCQPTWDDNVITAAFEGYGKIVLLRNQRQTSHGPAAWDDDAIKNREEQERQQREQQLEHQPGEKSVILIDMLVCSDVRMAVDWC
jgi:hypothetical protein